MPKTQYDVVKLTSDDASTKAVLYKSKQDGVSMLKLDAKLFELVESKQKTPCLFEGFVLQGGLFEGFVLQGFVLL